MDFKDLSLSIFVNHDIWLMDGTCHYGHQYCCLRVTIVTAAIHQIFVRYKYTVECCSAACSLVAVHHVLRYRKDDASCM